MSGEETEEQRIEREAREYLMKEYPGRFDAVSAPGASASAEANANNPNADLVALMNKHARENIPSPFTKAGQIAFENLPEIGGGTLAGVMARKAIPTDIQYNPNQNLTDLQKSYIAHQQAEIAHQQMLDQVAEAERNRAFAKTLTHEDFLPEHLKTQPTEAPLTSGEKWAKNWAGQDRPGVGSVPEASGAYQRSKGHGPVSSKQSSQWGPRGPNEPADLIERTLARNRKAEEELMHKQNAHTALAQQKARAEIEHENALKAAGESQKRLNEAQSRLKLPGEKGSVPATSEDVLERIYKQYSPFGTPNPSEISRILSRVGMKYMPRLVPGAGAAFAPMEFEKGVKQVKEGSPIQGTAHLIGGLGGIAQATNIPLLMGAGDLMQIPAMMAEAYELGQPKPKP
jgi:hypothetical protein